jgi:hypothetical protein
MIRDAQHRAGYETPIKLQKLNATTAACRGISVRVRDELPGWACKIRTGESVRALSHWNCVITSPDLAPARRAETVRVRAMSSSGDLSRRS